MKRSEINRIQREGEAFIRDHGYVLPQFGALTPSEMTSRSRVSRFSSIEDEAPSRLLVCDYGRWMGEQGVPK